MKVEELKRDSMDILNYLSENDNNFIPPLSSRVKLEEYAKKIYKHSVQLWVKHEHEFVGFCALYVNPEFTYISTISIVDKYKGVGAGKRLLNKVIDVTKRNFINEIRLEIQDKNKKVKSFYLKKGFTPVKDKKNMFKLIIENEK